MAFNDNGGGFLAEDNVEKENPSMSCKEAYLMERMKIVMISSPGLKQLHLEKGS